MLIDIHTHQDYKNDDVFYVKNNYPLEIENGKYFSCGIHPWYISEENIDNELMILNQKLVSKNCLALGECGLDKITQTPFELQKQVFTKQLKINQNHQKPVIIHAVKAHQEILEIQKREKIKETFLFHGFNKNENLLNQILRQENHVSFGKDLLKNQKLQTIFANLSWKEIFLETDSADLTIDLIYEKACELKKISISELEEIIKENASNFLQKNIE